MAEPSNQPQPSPPLSVIDTRGAQMFPTLAPPEVERLRRFGEIRHFADGEAVATVGQPGLGLSVILKGIIEIRRAGAAVPEETGKGVR